MGILLLTNSKALIQIIGLFTTIFFGGMAMYNIWNQLNKHTVSFEPSGIAINFPKHFSIFVRWEEIKNIGIQEFINEELDNPVEFLVVKLKNPKKYVNALNNIKTTLLYTKPTKEEIYKGKVAGDLYIWWFHYGQDREKEIFGNFIKLRHLKLKIFSMLAQRVTPSVTPSGLEPF